MAKATTLSQLELHALKSANYTDKKVAELAEDVTRIFEEFLAGGFVITAVAGDGELTNISATFEEIYNAHLEGQSISLHVQSPSGTITILQCSSIDADNAFFNNVSGISDGTMVQSAIIFSDNESTYMSSGTVSTEQFDALSETLAKLSVIVTPQMFGAKGDGITDDTAAIQAALDASSFVYIPDGVYMINGTNDGWGHIKEGGICPRSNQTIILSNNAILKANNNTTGFYNIVNIGAVDNVRIIGGKIQGDKTTPTRTSPAPGGEFGYGLSINGGSNVTVENMEIFDCWGDSVFIGGSSSGTNASNIKVNNCVLHDSRRQGISIVGCIDATIRDCEIYNIRGTAPQYGIDIEPDGSGIARNITIDNCYIHDNAVGGIVIPDTGTTNIIKGVNVTNCALDSINIQGGFDVNVNSSTVGIAYLKAKNLVRFSSGKIGKIYMYGGYGFFDNCEIASDTESYIIQLTNETASRKSKLVCHNCRISVPDETSSSAWNYLLYPNAANAVEMVHFINCHISMGTRCLIMLALRFDRLQFDNCRITYGSAPYEIFTCGTGGKGEVRVNNSEIIYSGSATNIASVGNSSVLDLEITNSKLSNAAKFIDSTSGASGTIRLFNNEMNTTSISGGSFEKFICNGIDTEPIAGSMNLITSGAVSEALANFTGGVSKEEFENLSKSFADDVSTLENSINDIKAGGVQQTPLFANSVNECVDTSKVYVLPDGYIHGYISTTEVTKLYNNIAKNIQQGWLGGGGGINTGGSYPNAVVCVDYIPFTNGTTVRIKGLGELTDTWIVVYGGTKAIYSAHKANAGSAVNSYSYDATSGIVTLSPTTSNVSFLRVSGVPTGAVEDIIITVNQEIKEELVTSYKWASTGHAFIPADYEARIIALENKLAQLENGL